ncbi:hypothetical protein F5Y18DRAFT_382952 [Xylariaceae sp. FL1019]|nr:hypothetical protein F5Y18DRAFT_382952 [Xylariaceae sp. FL1019]
MGSKRPASLLTLPTELRFLIYQPILRPVRRIQLYVFQHCRFGKVEVYDPRTHDKGHRKYTALLYVNRLINREYSALFYDRFQFAMSDLTDNEPRLLESFLDGIGPHNASQLSCISLSFPAIRDALGSKLREDGRRTLELLQERCPRLKNLHTKIHENNGDGLVAKEYCCKGLASQALSEINTQLKKMPLLREVLVSNFYEEFHPETVELMESFGWKIDAPPFLPVSGSETT